MLTIKGEPSNIVTASEAVADDYSVKPFVFQDLQARVAVGSRMVQMQKAHVQKIHELEQALREIKTLRGIVPVCAHCKKIRDSAGFWHQVEVYVSTHAEAEFSHSLCPDCMNKHYPEFVDRPRKVLNDRSRQSGYRI